MMIVNQLFMLSWQDGLTQRTWALQKIKDCYFVNYGKINKKLLSIAVLIVVSVWHKAI